MEEKEKCRECGAELIEEDYYGGNESRGEFWGAPCSEYVVYGYVCHECGYKEEF